MTAVLFDLDGTLVDGETAWECAHQNTARAYGGELTPAALRALAGVSLDVSVATILSVTHPCSADSVRERLLDEVAAVYRRGVPRLPGAQTAVAQVRAAGIPTGLVTNTPRRLTEIILGHLGWNLFDVVVCGDDVTEGKPAPAPYRRAADLLGVDPRECVAVEDSPAGELSARRAGATVTTVGPPRYLTGFTLPP